MSDLRTRLASIIADHTGWPAASIADETHFYDEMGFDTLDMLDALIEVEKALEIDTSDGEREGIATFGDLVRCVEGKLAVAV